MASTTGPFSLLPQELVDLIIFCLNDDKASLLSCALVHPTWTNISRRHLPYLTLIVSSSFRANELTSLLRSSHETLSSSITGITLIGDIPFDDILVNGKPPRARSYSKLLDVLKAKHVMLRSGVVENEPSVVGLFAQYFPDLASLQVVCASYRYITSFIRALAGSFPRLVELTIELGAGRLDLPDARLSGLRNLKLAVPCLRMLRVVGWNNEFVRWLGDNISGTLERLELDCTRARSTCRVQDADALIQGNKETLRDLRLGYVERRDSVVFDLTGVKGLKNLEVVSWMGATDLVLNMWRLPRSLERIYLQDVVRLLDRRCGRPGADGNGGTVIEGETLRRSIILY